MLDSKKEATKIFHLSSYNVVIAYDTNWCFNSNVMTENYMPAILDPYIAKHGLSRLNFFLDQMPCYKTPQVETALKARPIHHLHFPKLGTNMVQPADVAWMHLIKLRYCEKWQHWF